MIPASGLIHNAAFDALTTGEGLAKLKAAGVKNPAGTGGKAGGVTVNPADGQALPYVEFGQGTEADRDRSTDTRSSDVTLTSTIRAKSLNDCHAIAKVLVEETVRVLPLGEAADEGRPADGTEPYVTDATLDLYGPGIEDGGDSPVWTMPVRVRYRVFQPEPPATT